MKVQDLDLQGLKLIDLQRHEDSRGFFVERFNRDKFREAGLPNDFFQDNHSGSAPRVLRGIHYQFDPPQGKLVSCVRGKIWDLAVDLRENSPTFGKWTGVELNESETKYLWVPAGFGHGFCVLGNDPAEVIYKVDSSYSAEGEGGIIWNDSELGITWPIDDPLLSDKDQNQISFSDYRANPKF